MSTRDNQHIYQFDLHISVSGCGTTSHGTVRKTILAETEEQAREKLKDLTIEIFRADVKAVDPHKK